MKFRVFEMFDYILLICVFLLILMGILFVYSSGVNSEQISISNEYIKQIIFAGTGLPIMIFFAVFDYRRLERFVMPAFLVFLVISAYTMLFGRFVNGARSWIGIGSFGIQPSEFGKIVYIMFFARYLERSENTPPFKRLLLSFVIVAAPALLILMQPDMGTASVYFPVFIGMLFAAGIPAAYLGFIILTGVLAIVFTVIPVWQTSILQKSIALLNIFTDSHLRIIVIITLSVVSLIGITGYLFYRNRYYHSITWLSGSFLAAFVGSIMSSKVLKDYQIKRLIVFLNPYTDPLGSGWNIIQSRIAIGSGGIAGQGFLKGTQSHYRFLPQQSTDFIFSILSEEWGFLGGIFVFFLYSIVFFRFFLSIKRCDDLFGKLIVSGILAMFFFHFFVNVGMVMGIMPITGIPLLFLSV